MKLPKDFKIIGTELYPFQYESFVFCIQRDTAGLLLEMGCGKTLVSITVARYRIQKNDIKRILVLCPSSILYNWEKEILKFSEYKPLILHGANRAYKITEGDYDFGIINYESLFPLLKDLEIIKEERKLFIAPDAAEKIKALNIGMIIFDESARFIRNYKAQRTIACMILGDQIKYKLILTGTPIANKPLDIWSQFRVLDGGASFSRSYYNFQKIFFYKRSNHPWARPIIRPERIPMMTKLVYAKCIRKRKKDVLKEMPEQIYNTICVGMDDSTWRIYNDVKGSILSEIPTVEGKTQLKITNVLTMILRLQQITSGFTVRNGKEVELES